MFFKLPCYSKSGDEINLKPEEIFYIYLQRVSKLSNTTKIMISSSKGDLTFRLNGSLETCYIMLAPYGFEILENNVVNMSSIKWVDRKERKVFFDKNLHAYISKDNLFMVAHIPDKP